MKIITSQTEWTPINNTTSARIWDGKIWREDKGREFFMQGGSRLLVIGINTLRGREWLKEFGHDTTTCKAEVVNLIDPDGELRRSGQLQVIK